MLYTIRSIRHVRSRSKSLTSTRICAHPTQAYWASVLTRSGGGTRREDTVTSIRLLVYRDVMGESPKKVQLSFDEAKHLLWRCQESDVSKSPCYVSVSARLYRRVHLQRYPVIHPLKWPRNDDLGIRTHVTTTIANGVIHVGIFCPAILCMCQLLTLPRMDLETNALEVRMCTVRLDRFGCEKQEDPYAGTC